MNRQQPVSARTAFLCGLLTAAMGGFLVLIGLAVIPVNPRVVNAPLWIATAAGFCFLLAGLAVVIGAIHGVSDTGELPKDTKWWVRLLYYLVGVFLAGALASIGSWIAFGPGARNFGGTGLVMLSPEANATIGRILFGLGAVLSWLITIAIAVSGARKLFPDKSG